MSNADRCRRYRQSRHDRDMIRDMVCDMLRDMMPQIIQGVADIFRHAARHGADISMSHEKQESFPLNGFPPKKGLPHTPSKESTLFPLTPLSENTITTALVTKQENADFAVFWNAYPHKIGKGAAKSKYRIALTKTSSDVLLAGLERYKATKPPEREWCNPATWLHQERWLDVPASNGHASDSNVLPFGGGPPGPAPTLEELKVRMERPHH